MGHSNAFHPIYNSHDADILQLSPTESIEVIMDTYGDEIKRLIYTYMKNSADTDDVSQEVFVTVYEKLNTFKGESALKSWIYSIAINKCKDHLRSWQVRNKKLRDRLVQSTYALKRMSNTPEEDFVKQSESSQLLSQVMDLPVKYREVIVLYYFQEFSTEETSEILHVKEATVRTRLSRGRERLKQLLLVERGGDLG